MITSEHEVTRISDPSGTLEILITEDESYADVHVILDGRIVCFDELLLDGFDIDVEDPASIAKGAVAIERDLADPREVLGYLPLLEGDLRARVFAALEYRPETPTKEGG